MKVEDTKIYAVLKEVFEGTPEWPSVIVNLSTAIDQFGENFRDKEQLSSCFIWGDTYQSHGYWSDIDTKIKEFNNVKGLKMKEKKEETNLVSMDKQYTRNGKKIRVLCVDRRNEMAPVLVEDEDGNLYGYNKYGKLSYGFDKYDLKEYNPWQDVAVDTPVIVTYSFNGEDLYHKRHFSHYDATKGVVYVFGDGKTSYTSEPFDVVSTATAKLA